METPAYSDAERKIQRTIEVLRLPGLTPYAEALDMQRERLRAVEEGRSGNALFLLQHTPVVTLGRNARREHLLWDEDQLRARGIEVHKTNRGGDVTYHGPGQLIAYPVLNLHAWRLSIRWYLRALEEALIRVLSHYGLAGERVEGYTGAWVGGAKVAAIGIGVHNWVTFHGIALNVDPDMSHFDCIVPCGIPDKPVTSLHQLLGKAPPMSAVMAVFERTFVHYFESA